VEIKRKIEIISKEKYFNHFDANIIHLALYINSYEINNFTDNRSAVVEDKKKKKEKEIKEKEEQ